MHHLFVKQLHERNKSDPLAFGLPNIAQMYALIVRNA